MKKIILLFILLVVQFPFTACLQADSRRVAPIKASYVSCHLNGQLGNQLFQISTALAYAWDYGAIPIFPELSRTDFNISFNRDKIFFRLNANNPPVGFKNTYKQPEPHDLNRVPYSKNLWIDGYFQSWRHFHHHRNELIATFALSDSDKNYLINKYKDLIANPNTVAVHVRTRSSHTHYLSYPFVGLEYYRKAMELFPEGTTFVIFSDRIQWCKKHFANFKKRMVFIEGNDLVQDLHLMAMMKNVIICNSTFSWWGAYLNQHEDKVVIAPRHWYHPNFRNMTEEEMGNFYLPDWQLLEQDLNAIFPEDAEEFPTQSVDDR